MDGQSLSLEDLPARCPNCSAFLKPDVVFFGESIPWEAQLLSSHESEKSQVMLVIGTSAAVYPAASIPMRAKEYGAIIIEINKEPTPATDLISDYLICGSAGEIIPKIVKEIRRSQG